MNTQTDIQMDQDTISALMDGQLNGAELTAALRGMARAEARERWLVYHLAGDVLRSSELARGCHDAAFVQGVMQRLGPQAHEMDQSVSTTVVTSRQAANDGVFRWKLVAGLASFAAVAAVGWGMLGSVGPQAPGPQLAQAPTIRAAGGGAQALVSVPAPVVAEAGGAPSGEAAPVMLRDARLDELLAAHRAAAGASALGSTAGFLRNATFEGPGR